MNINCKLVVDLQMKSAMNFRNTNKAVSNCITNYFQFKSAKYKIIQKSNILVITETLKENVKPPHCSITCFTSRHKTKEIEMSPAYLNCNTLFKNLPVNPRSMQVGLRSQHILMN
jgi:hypothetical protein